MSDAVIRLTVPGELPYRDVAIRAVAAACRLIREGAISQGTALSVLDLRDDFDAQLVSAVSEIFNNIVIHGYNRDGGQGATPPYPIEFELRLKESWIEVVITDNGPAFDIESIPAPELESLPEGGMGIHIARSCVDDLDYVPGPPNRWRLTKSAVADPKSPAKQA